MLLSIDQLKSTGAFTGRPIEKEVTWKQGDKEHTATVFVRPLGFQTAVNQVLSTTGKVDGVAGRIAASICDADGNPVFTVLDITHGPIDPEELAKDPKTTKRLGALDGDLTVALLSVIYQVNDLGKTSSSPTTTSSGTNSSSTGSAGKRSRKPRK